MYAENFCQKFFWQSHLKFGLFTRQTNSRSKGRQFFMVVRDEKILNFRLEMICFQRNGCKGKITSESMQNYF